MTRPPSTPFARLTALHERACRLYHEHSRISHHLMRTFPNTLQWEILCDYQAHLRRQHLLITRASRRMTRVVYGEKVIA